MSRTTQGVAVLAALATTATAAVAQIRPAYEFPAERVRDGPATVQLGDTPIHVAPYVTLGFGRDDNILYSPDNEISSNLYTLAPGFELEARVRNQVFQLSYGALIGRYTDSEEDDFEDHTLRGQYDVQFDSRNFLRLGVDHLRARDPRGTTDRPIGAEPDEYKLTSPYAAYAFGAEGARGRAELYYFGYDRKYLTNRQFTQFADRKTHEVGGAFYWRVGAKTRLLGEVRNTDINYRIAGTVEQGAGFDSEERRYFVGVSFEPTVATSGTFKVGRLEKRFDVDNQKHSDNVWEANLTWAPRPYSSLEFTAARTTNEGTGLGRFIYSDIYKADWRHAWSSFIATTVTLRRQRDDYQDFNRTDDITAIGLKVDYRVRRWLTLGAEYAHTRRDSTLPFTDYDKNLYLLTASMTL